MKSKTRRSALALLLSLVLCLSLFPASAFAEVSSGPDNTVGDGALDVPQNSDNPSVSVADSSPYTGGPEEIAVTPAPEAVADEATNASGSVVDSGTCGAQGNNISWTLYSDGELVISGSGAMADYTEFRGPLYWRYLNAIRSITVGSGVTRVGDYAFERCGTLTSVTLPTNLTSIGDGAFEACWSLTSITIPTGVTSIGNRTFSNCSSLTSITIPAGVTSIGDGAFLYCGSLTSIELPAGVTSIGDFAFQICYSLTSIALPANLTSIGNYAFSSCSNLASITLPASLTSIGCYAFNYCISLTSIALPASLTSIGEYAFSGCSSLTSIAIPARVASIGDGVFSNCSSLSSISVAADNPYYTAQNSVLFDKAQTKLLCCPGAKNGVFAVPNSVESIGDSAFGGCSRLTGVTLPAGLTSIGGGAFTGCSSLTSITIPAGVTNIGNWAFASCSSLTGITIDSTNSAYASVDGVLFNKSKTELLCCPAGKSGSYNVPSGVIVIDSAALSGCSRLTGVTLPAGLTSIGDWAFDYCSSLTSITLPASVTNIGDSAFYGCSSLTSIALPAGLTSIGISTFSGCESLADVYFGGTESQKNERVDNGWRTDDNDLLFNATWHYGVVIPAYDCILPAFLTAIESEAMAGCAFSAVRIPDGVTAIGAKAFAGSPNLKAVYIPASVTSIASNAFYQVTGLTIIGKAGSEAEDYANALGFAFIEG